MDESPSMGRVFESLRTLAERVSAEFPGAARALADLVAGDAEAGGSPFERLAGALDATQAAGPDAWVALSARLSEWAYAFFSGADSQHPVVVALRGAAGELGELAAQALAGAPMAEARLNELVMPWVEKIGATCVDVMLGELR